MSKELIGPAVPLDPVRGQIPGRCARGGRPATGLSRLAALVLGLAAVALLPACKLQVEVPRGGKVVTESKSFTCKPRQTCEIDVVDQFFSETFIAVPNDGYAFMRWEKVGGSFCGDRMTPCELSTEGFDGIPALYSLLETDNVYYLRPVFEPIPTIRQEDLEAEGDVEETADGFEVSGSLTMNNGQGAERLFKDANLKLEFNANGELKGVTGAALLPPNLVERVDLNVDVLAEIGYFTGAQLNANEEVGITLRDERQYLLFLIGGDVSFTETVAVPGEKPKKVQQQVNTPASGKVVMILDPNDDMLYRYGETPTLGAYGEAKSDQGLIPYVPFIEGNTRIYRFDGHLYKTVSVGVGIKLLDVFNLTGEQVTYQPSLFDVDLSDPFNSPIAYKAGFNGAAEVAVSVAGFDLEGLFNFDLAEASAAFEVSKNRQIMTLAAELAPDVEWLPAWVRIVPTYSIAFDLTATGKGKLVFNLSGAYESELPPADIEGSVRITPQALTMQGVVPGDPELPLKLTFADGNTYGEVGITADIRQQLQAELASGFDRAEDEVARALADLEQAAADYEFELSLRGLRSSIPGIVDAAIVEMDKVPGIVYNAVYAAVKDGIDANNVCVTNPLNGKKSCIISTSTRNSKAAEAASTARSQATSRIAPYKAALAELKRSALEDDSPEFVSTLEAALRLAYDNRVFSEKFTVTVEIAVPGPNIKVTKSYTVTRNVLSASQAAAVLEAANNVHLIPETSALVVSAQEIVDRLPTEEILDQVRRSVEDGLTAVPAVKGVSYGVIDDKYVAAVLFSDGSQYDVDFNVLDGEALLQGIADLLVDYTVEQF